MSACYVLEFCSILKGGGRKSYSGTDPSSTLRMDFLKNIIGDSGIIFYSVITVDILHIRVI